jgi:hypothetical protein
LLGLWDARSMGFVEHRLPPAKALRRRQVQPDDPLSTGSCGMTGSVSFRAAICPQRQAK